MQKLSLETLGRRLEEKRGELGIRAVAAEIGVSPATLSRVERGYLPDLETFSKICKWLQVDPGQVLGVTSPNSSVPRVAVHFRKSATLSPATAQALAKMVVAAHRAWLTTQEDTN
jgi:transcriptional regulator with XRE-family HTH domain